MVRIVTGLLILTLTASLSWWLMSRVPARGEGSVRGPASTATARKQPPTARAAPPPKASSELAAPDARAAAREPAEHPLSDAVCPPDMLLIDAEPCPAIRRKCLARGARGECATYAEARPCRSRLDRRTYCIDRFEYPNIPGGLPAMLMTFEQASAACRHESKRLCTGAEWTLACGGRDHAPYPQGTSLGVAVCNVGPIDEAPDVEMLWNAQDLPALVDRFEGRRVSGASAECVSGFGVHDLTGNVAEWVEIEGGGRFPGALAGGDFATRAVTCEVVRRIGKAHYAAFGAGARCCADPLVKIPRRR